MLPRTLRIQRDADFSRVYRKGQRFHAGHFVLTVSKNTLTHPRFACIVSKTISKKAVIRNKVRRLVHEALQKELRTNSNLVSSPVDVLISAKKGSDACTLQEISQEFAPIWKRILTNTFVAQNNGKKTS